MAQLFKLFFVNLLWDCSKWKVNDQIMVRAGEFHRCNSSNLKTVNLEIFAKHERIYTWRYSPDQSIKLWKDLFFRLILKRFQTLCHDQPDFDILLGKLTAQTSFAHYGSRVGDFMPGYFFNIFSGVLYLYDQNLELFQICQSLGEGTL